MGLFKKNKEVAKAVEEEVVKAIENTSEEVNVDDEWVWVTGFKGTEKDMTCHGYQYELNKQFDISDDQEVEVCKHGFHMCLKLSHVYEYYGVKNGNRFFEVKALVRKKDKDDYGKRVKNSYLMFQTEIDKLVAKSIIFTRELTMDEIFTQYSHLCKDWSDDDKRTALEIGVKAAEGLIKLRKLTSVGYSETFAKAIIECKKFDIAYAVGSQEDLSMDMKVWTIFNGK